MSAGPEEPPTPAPPLPLWIPVAHLIPPSPGSLSGTVVSLGHFPGAPRPGSSRGRLAFLWTPVHQPPGEKHRLPDTHNSCDKAGEQKSKASGRGRSYPDLGARRPESYKQCLGIVSAGKPLSQKPSIETQPQSPEARRG